MSPFRIPYESEERNLWSLCLLVSFGALGKL